MGGLAFVPVEMPGAGRLKITSTTRNVWYDATVTLDGSGTYTISRNPGVGVNLGAGVGPEGIVYVPPGSPLFPICQRPRSGVRARRASPSYQVNANGDPITSTRRTFISGLQNAEGAAVDPLTGDFLFSTFGNRSRV